MLHPVMPHITEELYSSLPVEGKAEFLMSARWPEIDPLWRDEQSEAKVERIFEITRALRSLRASVDLAAMKTAPVAYVSGDLGGNEEILRTQAWFEQIQLSAPPDGEKCVSTTVEGVDLYLPLGDLVDPVRELDRLAKEEEKLRAELVKIQGQLGNPQFVEKAKPEFVDRLRANEAEITDKLAKIDERRRMFS
jgi:valyl-tRNA synthetase